MKAVEHTQILDEEIPDLVLSVMHEVLHCSAPVRMSCDCGWECKFAHPGRVEELYCLDIHKRNCQ